MLTNNGLLALKWHYSSKSKAKFSTTTSSIEVSSNKYNANGQPEINVVAETGNDIFGIMTDVIEIPTVNLGLSTRASSKKLYTGDYDRYRKW